MVLVEWEHWGEYRHQACETEAHQATCLYVISGLQGVRNVVVWDDVFVQYMVSIGRCGHA